MIEERKRSRRRAGGGEEIRRQLMEGMADTQAELSRAYAQFDLHTDPDLVDSCVYAINALRCRYSYYIRRIKELDERGEEAG